MIRVTRTDAPCVLVDTEGSGEAERDRIIAHYETGTPVKRPPFRAFKDPEVKQKLSLLFGGKCAYCESRYDNVAPMDVEHYRPKSEVRQLDGKSYRPGYYWLAATWENLLPSCIDCNRARTQTLLANEGQQRTAVSGKETLFPLFPEPTGPPRRGEEMNETPLLLDPCEATCCPERFLEFTDDGFVRPKVGKHERRRAHGAATIEVCGLAREALVRARRRRLKDLFKDMKSICDWEFVRRSHPNDRRIADRLREAWQALEEQKGPEHTFLALTRQMINSFKRMWRAAGKYDKAVGALDQDPDDLAHVKEVEAQIAHLNRFLDPARPDHNLAKNVFDWCGIELPSPG